MRYTPTWSSFLGSAAFAMSPAATAGVVTFFVWENAGAVVLVAGVVTALLSLYLLLQTVFVHLQRVDVHEQGIVVAGPLNRSEIRWSEAIGAVLKERQNLMTRTDHLLIIRGRNALLLFNTSTLSESDEKRLLDFIRGRVALVVEQSKPSI